MRRGGRVTAGAALVVAALLLGGCTAPLPEPPTVVGAGFPSDYGCMPAAFEYPSEFLRYFPGEDNRFGPVASLRLEYHDGRFVWRIREHVEDIQDGRPVPRSPKGRESLVDAGSLELVQSAEIELTEAEMASGRGRIDEAALAAGEEWDSAFAIEAVPAPEDPSEWRITVCDMQTREARTVFVSKSDTKPRH